MSDALREKRFTIYTLGCKVNQYESDSMEDILKNNGAFSVPSDEKADIVIINTCAVTGMAEKKSRQIIHRMKKLNPDSVCVVCGCYVQSGKGELEKDETIDIIVSNNRKKDIARILEEYYAKNAVSDNYIDINKTNEYESMVLYKPTEHTRAYVKVQDGCNNFCSYCIIPYVRGRIRSKELKDVIAELSGLADNGIKEVVITGINLSSYKDEEGNGLTELLLAAAKIEGIVRIRMGSLEPRVITRDFLEAISKEKKICPHFHLSLQSACNETLKRMNRKYSIEEYMERCDLIREYYDNPAITTDIIVGFPGETDDEFKTTYNNLEKLNLYEMHIFKYSKRKGTVACDMENQVPEEIKNERSDRLLEMTAKHKKSFEDKFKGSSVTILAEEYERKQDKGGKDSFIIKGHTERYLYISKEFDEDFCKSHINELVEVDF